MKSPLTNYFWRRRHARRVEKELCQLIELLALIVEAGTDLLSAFATITPLLREGELKKTAEAFLQEIRLGKQRYDALQVWTQRLPLASVEQLVHLLQQAWQTGGGVGRLLRVQADQLRQQRDEKARRRATQLPFLVLIPLLLFILPSALLIILMPLFISFQSIMSLP